MRMLYAVAAIAVLLLVAFAIAMGVLPKAPEVASVELELADFTIHAEPLASGQCGVDLRAVEVPAKCADGCLTAADLLNDLGARITTEILKEMESRRMANAGRAECLHCLQENRGHTNLERLGRFAAGVSVAVAPSRQYSAYAAYLSGRELYVETAPRVGLATPLHYRELEGLGRFAAGIGERA
jgi:hypothetical protein